MVQPKFARQGRATHFKGLFGTCGKNLSRLPQPIVLQDFLELLEGVQLYRGQEGELEDDITLLTLRRVT